ncbi:NAD(P)H-dependent oxidoreductase [Microvirga arsenatis]|uniref:NAD(P)H-dependent oxidoreductase n=1 Tax=Microvirga arsenatis TaxID=2692265 RepID=UPI0031B583E7
METSPKKAEAAEFDGEKPRVSVVVLEEALRAVEQADLLLIGTPVHKGSYTGLFKHFVDLIDCKSLAGVSVALLAMGGPTGAHS